MFEIEAGGLQYGDQFTLDNGETWFQVKTVRHISVADRVVVIDTNGKEHIFKSETKIIVK